MPATRRRDYLFKRDGSQFWHLRIQEGGRSISKSLRTTDKGEAEILALPIIAEHKRRLMALRPRLESVPWIPRHQPGRLHSSPDGQFLATERELHHLDANGAVVRIEPNGGPGHNLVNMPMGAVLTFGDPNGAREIARARGYGNAPIIDLKALERPAVATKNDDDALFEAYLKHKNVSGYGEREARHLWSLFKTLTDGKPLKDCTREDGRKLVAHLEAQGLKSASVRRKINWLRAACNFGIDEKKLTFNPFSKVAPKRDDSIERLPLDDADMAEANRNLDKLRDADQLLFRVLATTGMRLSEAFQIDSEKIEGGCRFVIIGRKTAQSKRRVPLPADLLPHLPEKIKRPLFKGATGDASKRLNTWLNDIGITDPAKVVHSLRHRAQDCLRAAGCPEDVRHELLGHEKKTVASGYGKGFPVPLLRQWIDKIGL